MRGEYSTILNHSVEMIWGKRKNLIVQTTFTKIYEQSNVANYKTLGIYADKEYT